MRTPLIAIPAAHLQAGTVAGWRPGGFAVAETYIAALRRAGARPLLLTAPEPAPADEVIAPFDGLLLTGGGDFEPEAYGAPEVHAATCDVEPGRDALELDLIRAAVRLGVPVLGICRGLQAVNIALGGTLHQHIPDLKGGVDHGTPAGNGAPVTHDLRLKAGSLAATVAGVTELQGTARHHQAVDRLGQGLLPTGWTSDGVVEALEGADGWVLAVQWHPEVTADRDPVQQRFFDALAERARTRQLSRAA